MENNTEMIDQSPLAEDITEKIKFDFVDSFLVKQLDPIKVKKEFSEPVNNGKEPKKDKNGIEAIDFDNVKTEVREVDSDFRKGIVLKIPMSFERLETKPFDIKVGDVILFRNGSSLYFDLLKDGRLVTYYNIVAIAK